VREDVAIKRIECGIVDIGREHALFQVIEVLCPSRLCVVSGPSGRAGKVARATMAT
jgi:hypothetical protein